MNILLLIILCFLGLQLLIILLESFNYFKKYNIQFKDYLQKFCIYDKKLKKVDFLLHAVSCGEALSLQPIINYLERKKYSYLITVHTPTGYHLLSKKNKNVILKPFDTFFTIAYLFYCIQPKIICIAESDTWPHYIALAKYLNIKIYFFNYTKKNKPFRNLVHKFIATQIFTKEKIGNLKILSTYIPMILHKKFDTIIIASASQDEFKIHLEYMKYCINLKKDVKIIYVPRHLNWKEEFDRMMDLEYYLFYDCRENDINILLERYNILVVWSIGNLNQMYKYSKICLMGDTFNKVGGHNIIEPGVNNNFILLGPNYETCKDLIPYVKQLYIVDNIQELKEKTLDIIQSNIICNNKEFIIKKKDTILSNFTLCMDSIDEDYKN
ncbi:3-Deoxy-D-manno-octulosonic-acid transferase (kdotransferase) [seawater metagenome]|uniref:3-Deoxy-D-manno-octulosonic-acid transferase (Kdotransferase) n=1 Tax=seawater metagenome TaxID=1561972 RepID=A0A5E8CK50_9ZZZZ